MHHGEMNNPGGHKVDTRQGFIGFVISLTFRIDFVFVSWVDTILALFCQIAGSSKASRCNDIFGY